MKRALFCAFLLFSSALLAESLEEGFRAYEQQDYATAAKHWRVVADSGDATAQFNLGQMYRLGKGVSQSDEQAAQWYLLAARQGSSHARHNLKMMYQDGRLDEATIAEFKEIAPDMANDLASASAAPKAQETAQKTTAQAQPQSPAMEKPASTSSPVVSVEAKESTEADRKPATGNESASSADWQNWLPQQNARAYIVQIMASGAKNDILQTLNSRGHLLPESRGYVRTRSRGQNWYVLLLGPYADIGAARAAIKQLPDDLRRNKPWPRRVSAVTAIMR